MFRSYTYKLILLLGSILVGVYTPAVAECDSMGDVIVAKSMQLDDKESIEFLEKMYTDSVHSYSKETRLCILNTLKSHYTNSGLLQKQFDTELRILETLVFYDRVEAQIRITQSEKLCETLSANKLFDRKKAMGGLLTQKAILKFYEKEFDAG